MDNDKDKIIRWLDIKRINKKKSRMKFTISNIDINRLYFKDKKLFYTTRARVMGQITYCFELIYNNMGLKFIDVPNSIMLSKNGIKVEKYNKNKLKIIIEKEFNHKNKNGRYTDIILNIESELHALKIKFTCNVPPSLDIDDTNKVQSKSGFSRDKTEYICYNSKPYQGGGFSPR